jgi:hypothetical protein
MCCVYRYFSLFRCTSLVSCSQPFSTWFMSPWVLAFVWDTFHHLMLMFGFVCQPTGICCVVRMFLFFSMAYPCVRGGACRSGCVGYSCRHHTRVGHGEEKKHANNGTYISRPTHKPKHQHKMVRSVSHKNKNARWHKSPTKGLAARRKREKCLYT